MSQSHPLISILVPTFNRAQFLADCLDSLLTQTLPASQILVIDDGSTDGTQKLLERYEGRVEILNTPQVGKAESLNQGMRRVSGEYVWIFDDDDVALPNALERFTAPLERFPEYGYSFSSFYFTQSDPLTHRLAGTTGENPIPDIVNRGPLLPLLEVNYLGGAALFARAACYRELGDFDPRLVRSQDYEMAIRIVRRFRGVQVEGGPTFHYRQHAELRGSSRDRFSEQQRNIKWLEYDQIFFTTLYSDLPLDAYLPPGADLKKREREALLERFMIMANKYLVAEALTDLDLLAGHSDQGFLTIAEKRILEMLVSGSWYLRMAKAFQKPEIVRKIRTGCARSGFMRQVRSEISGLILRDLLRRRGWRGLRSELLRLIRLYA